MKENSFATLLRKWCADPKQIHKWVFSAKGGTRASNEVIEEVYEKVRTMWFDYRDVFPNKGTYKMVRRMFVRYVALFFVRQPCLWSEMSAELCKEILHKEDQQWLSFYYRDRQFVDYLLWKASKAGYSKRRGPKVCYVNANLEIVFRQKEAVGVANLLSARDLVEILFFEPLSATNITRKEAVKLLEKLDKTKYPKGVWDFPTIETCKIANIFCSDKEPIVRNCHVNPFKNEALYCSERTKAILDEEGVFDFAGSKTRVESVFVSLYLPKDCFSGHGFPCHYIVDWWVPGW